MRDFNVTTAISVLALADGAYSQVMFDIADEKGKPVRKEIYLALQAICTLERMFYPERTIKIDLDTIDRGKVFSVPLISKATCTEVMSELFRWNLKERAAAKLTGEARGRAMENLQKTAILHTHEFKLYAYWQDTEELFDSAHWPVFKDNHKADSIGLAVLNFWHFEERKDYIEHIVNSMRISHLSPEDVFIHTGA